MSLSKQRISQLIDNPSSATEKDLDGLKNLLTHQPFFQAGYVIMACATEALNTSDKNARLHEAALHTGDRALLRELIQKSVAVSEAHIETTDTTQETEEIEETEVVVSEEVIIEEVKIEEASVEIVEEIEVTEVEEEPVAEEPEPLTVKESNESDIDISWIQDNEDDAEENDIYKELQANLNALKHTIHDMDEEETEEAKPPTPQKETPVRKAAAKKKTAKKSPTKKTTVKKTKSGTTKSSSSPPAKKVSTETKSTSKDSTQKKKVVNKKRRPEDNPFIDELLQKDSLMGDDKNPHVDLITRFIEHSPQIKAQEDPSISTEDLAIRSTKLHDDAISENLAIIMAKQGKIDQAVEIYRKLIWKFPQKKTYFATQIEKLKK